MRWCIAISHMMILYRLIYVDALSQDQNKKHITGTLDASCPDCLVSGTTTNRAVTLVSVSGAHHGAALQTPSPMSLSATLLYCVCVVFTSLYWSSRLNKFTWIKVLHRYDRFPSFKLHRGDLWDQCRSEEELVWHGESPVVCYTCVK